MTFQVDASKLRQAKPIGHVEKHSWLSRIFIGIPVAILVVTVLCALLSILMGVFAWIFAYPFLLFTTIWSVLFGRAGQIPEKKK